MTIVPAYGRDYKSKAALLADFEAGKDFKIVDMSSPDDGRVTDREDLIKSGTRSVNVRYKALRQIAVIKLPGA